MKTPKQTRPLAPFKAGQVWALEESKVHISEVGKMLVFYKHLENGIKRAPVSLASQKVLAAYLIDHRAVLLQV